MRLGAALLGLLLGLLGVWLARPSSVAHAQLGPDLSALDDAARDTIAAGERRAR